MSEPDDAAREEAADEREPDGDRPDADDGQAEEPTRTASPDGRRADGADEPGHGDDSNESDGTDDVGERDRETDFAQSLGDAYADVVGSGPRVTRSSEPIDDEVAAAADNVTRVVADRGVDDVLEELDDGDADASLTTGGVDPDGRDIDLDAGAVDPETGTVDPESTVTSGTDADASGPASLGGGPRTYVSERSIDEGLAPGDGTERRSDRGADEPVADDETTPPEDRPTETEGPERAEVADTFDMTDAAVTADTDDTDAAESEAEHPVDLGGEEKPDADETTATVTVKEDRTVESGMSDDDPRVESGASDFEPTAEERAAIQNESESTPSIDEVDLSMDDLDDDAVAESEIGSGSSDSDGSDDGSGLFGTLVAKIKGLMP